MKKTLLCLLLALCLCLSCIMLIACNDDEEPVDDPATDVAPGDEEVGKKGEIQTEKVPADPDYISPDNAETNQQQPGGTVRY